ncbi:hypothetical protein ATCV1_z552R [Acanthocystis turfacea chlorella virus 1]|uniref:Uncharacterized protein z552R n=1 Tax=Chlorovirus heliozoae TaxID=322019 RepID=A7K9G2_9PHYC|nr:hypothetical protein ATCV1_z552R [Acanthocystis turfacea chlorella virus 1]ABT16686.1 hypothetical protein ATCV1_z552R [Acanthocystis turfacea chlorella virus 1]
MNIQLRVPFAEIRHDLLLDESFQVLFVIIRPRTHRKFAYRDSLTLDVVNTRARKHARGSLLDVSLEPPIPRGHWEHRLVVNEALHIVYDILGVVSRNVSAKSCSYS